MRIVKSVYAAIGTLSELVGRVAIVLIVVLIAIVNYEVVMRYLFNAPTSWSHILSYLLGAVIACLGLAFVWRRNANIRIDVLYSRFPKKGKLIVDIGFTLFFFFPLIILLTMQFGQLALNSYRIGETAHLAAWKPLIWPFRTCVFIGFLLLLLQAFSVFVRDVISLVKGGKEPW